MALSEKTENKTKVLVNVYAPLIALMKHKMDAACLKRDAYLERALRSEIDDLSDEITTPNSDKAKSYIADNLKQIILKPLNLLLSTETVELMNEVCKEKNVPRDAFINRFFLLNIASDTVIDALFFRAINRYYYQEWRSENENHSYWESSRDKRFSVHWDCMMTLVVNRSLNNLDAIEMLIKLNSSTSRLLKDVFSQGLEEKLSEGIAIYDEHEEEFYIHSYAFEKNALQKLPNEYAFLKTDNVLGFNTFMTDDEVSQQEALDKAINKKVELDRLLAFTKKEKQAKAAKTKPAGETQ
jgi:hypothetical protein